MKASKTGMEQTIFERVRALDFPDGKYLVVGGSLEAHGLRKAHDVDIMATPDFYDQLKQAGYTPCDCTECRTSNRILLKGTNGVDILPDHSWGKYQPDPNRLIKEADIIDGLPFIRLESLLEWKKAYYLTNHRPKDKHDIDEIQQWIDDKKLALN